MQRTASIQLRGLEVLRIEMMVGPFLLIASNQDSIKIIGVFLSSLRTFLVYGLGQKCDFIVSVQHTENI